MTQERNRGQDDKRGDMGRGQLDTMRHNIRVRPSFVRLPRTAALDHSGRSYPSLSTRPAARPPSD